jgi:hypothetical protein
VVDIALQCYNKVSVSLYDTLGKDSVGAAVPFLSEELLSLKSLRRIHVIHMAFLEGPILIVPTFQNQPRTSHSRLLHCGPHSHPSKACTGHPNAEGHRLHRRTFS